MKELTIKDIAKMAGVSHTEDGYRTGLAYFTRCIKKKKSIATGILCISDHFALGVMQAAVETRVDIPGQISLIGFDDVSFASLPKNPTDYHFPSPRRRSVKLLCRRWKN